MTITLKIVLVVVFLGVVLLAISYLAEFFIPLIIGIVLLVIAYFIYRYLTTGVLPF